MRFHQRPSSLAASTAALIAALAALLASASAVAHGPATHSAKTTDSAPVAEQLAWGIAAAPRAAARTITIRMGDNMRFTPDNIELAEGDTLRVVVHNDGAQMHEMVIGTPTAIADHAELMKKFPGMEHDEPWMAHVAPGGKGEITWTFNRPGRFEFACLIAGHRDAGMSGSIMVRPGTKAGLALR